MEKRSRRIFGDSNSRRISWYDKKAMAVYALAGLAIALLTLIDGDDGNGTREDTPTVEETAGGEDPVRRNPSRNSRELVFEKASLFTVPGRLGTLNLDLRVNNPASMQIAINELKLRFYGDKECGGPASIREVSATYEIFDDGIASPQQEGQKYPVSAWYPYPGTDCFVVKGDLQQLVSAGESDRFQIIADIEDIPLPSHNRVVVELGYQIEREHMQAEYTVGLR